MKFEFKKHSVLPGFGLTFGFTMFYLSLIVLIPLSTLFFKTATLDWSAFWHTVTSERVLAAYRISLVTSFFAALVNLGFGLLVAWVLARYSFPGKRFIDGIVDLPFALPTAVAGIALTTLYAPNGWIGRFFAPEGLVGRLLIPTGPIGKLFAPDGLLGRHFDPMGPVGQFFPFNVEIKTAYSPIGIFIALTFISLPFVVRTVQPVLEDLNRETEEASACLGAGRWRTFLRVILPELRPALLTGFSLAFARALGEYGSVVFISGNMPMKTEIAPLLIMTKLEQFDYAGATSVALVMLLFSFLTLLFINIVSWRSQRASAAH